jgi:PASTA domain
MQSLEQVKKLREEYERALDAVESRRAAYHEAVLELHQGGTPLREIAQQLGLSHQRVHQIVSGEPPRRSKLPRAAGGIGAVLLLVAATFGALRLAHAPPFVPTVQVPLVIQMRGELAAGRLVQNGLNARVIWRRKNIGRGLIDHVYAESPAPGKRITKGSTVTVYVEMPAKHFHCAGPNGKPCPTKYFYKALS